MDPSKHGIPERKRNRLTARFVDTIATPGKYHDKGGLGLYLRVTGAGSRQWVQRVMARGKRHEIGLGSPPVVTLAMARQAALENKRAIHAGRDPLQERREARAGLTFADAVDKYLAAKLHEFRNEKHKKQWRSTLDTYAVPVLGQKRVSEIDTQDVLKALHPIWQGKTETAKRLRGRIEAVLSWATVAGHRKGDNPARWKGNLSEILPKPGKVAKTGNQPALALADVPRWWADLSGRDGMTARALQFLALTAARSGEVRGMTWEEVTLPELTELTELTTALWVIPASRMKAGRAHRVPLTQEAVALLKALPRMKGSDYVFPAARGGALSDMALSACMRRINEARYGGDLDPRSGRPAVPHGLRSTFRDWAAERTEFERDMAEIALAHNVGSTVERAYRRGDMIEKRRQMMAAWARFLKGAAGAKVVKMEAAR